MSGRDAVDILVNEELLVSAVDRVVQDGLVQPDLDVFRHHQGTIQRESVADLGGHSIADALLVYCAGLEDLGWYTSGDEYVVTDELGIPFHPESYSDEFTRMLRRAGLRKIRLHDSRHTTLSLMEKADVPISIVSKWAGHYDAAFTMKTYVHPSDEDLKQDRQALAKIHRIA